MELSRLEFYAMNNPIRRIVQRYVEFELFKVFLRNHNMDLAGKALLDAGCGSGYSTLLIQNEFKPSLLVGFDYMPEQIHLAVRRGLGAHFFVGDASCTPLLQDTFDATFIFGVLHHISHWRAALSHISRVLKPEGILLVEELDRDAVLVANLLMFTHPEDAAFSWNEFRSGLREAGFGILEERKILIPQARSFLCQKTPKCL